MVEDAIRQPDLAKSVQRYQLAIDEAKVRLNLAVCPGAWLMPARMLINTESTVGYNNHLKQVVQGMKLGINNGVNTSSHPSNPIHKAATAESKKDPKPAAQTKNQTHTDQTENQTHTDQTQTQTHTNQTKETTEQTEENPTPTAGSGSESHDVNKIVVAVGAVAVAGLMFLSFR